MFYPSPAELSELQWLSLPILLQPALHLQAFSHSTLQNTAINPFPVPTADVTN